MINILGKTIGEGTFGKVKLGIHLLTNEEVIIKENLINAKGCCENIGKGKISWEGRSCTCLTWN